MMQQAVADDGVVMRKWQRRARQNALNELDPSAQCRRFMQSFAGELQHGRGAVETVHDEAGVTAGETQHDVARTAPEIEHGARRGAPETSSRNN